MTEHSHPELDRRLDRLEQRFDRSERRLDRIETRLDRIEQQLSELQAQNDRMSLEIGLILQTLNQHTRMLTEIQASLRDRGPNGGTQN